MTAVPTETLLKQVQQRQAFLKAVLAFIPQLVCEKGRQTEHEVRDCYTKTTYVFDDFMGLSFYSHGAFSMYGGENLKIWRGSGADKKLLLDVDWWETDKPKVNRFDPATDWQRKVLRMAKDKKETLQKAEQQRKRVEAAAERSKAAELRTSERTHRLRQLEAKLPQIAKELGF